MINLLLAIIPTFSVWLVTVLVMNVNLPLFQMYLVYAVSYLMIKEVKYEVGVK